MNADIKGMIEYFKHRPLNILIDENGKTVDSKEAKEYLKWCLKNGYKELKNAPSWAEYTNQLKEK